MARTLYLLLLGFFPYGLLSQSSSYIDSLQNYYETQAEDTTKVVNAHSLSTALMYNDRPSSFAYAKEGLDLANSLAYLDGQGVMYLQLGGLYSFTTQKDSSRYFYQLALENGKRLNNLSRQAKSYYGLGSILFGEGKLPEAEQMGKEMLKIDMAIPDSLGIALDYDYLGVVLQTKGEYEKAFAYFYDALRILETMDEEVRKADVLIHLATVEGIQKHYKEAISYTKQALGIYQKANDQYYTSQAYNDIGTFFERLEQLDSARWNYEASLAVSKKVGWLVMQGTALSNLGDILTTQSKPKEAIPYLLESIEVFEKTNNDRKIAISRNMLARAYNKMGQPQKALAVVEPSINYSKENDSRETLMNGYAYRSFSHESLGNYQRALEDFKQVKILSDSLFEQERSKQIEQMRAQYEAEKKEAELAVQAAEIESLNKEIKLSNLRKALYGLGMLALLALSALLVIWFRQKIRKQRLENEKKQALFEQQLAFKKKELMSQTLHLTQKNTFIQELQDKLALIKQEPERFQQEYKQLQNLIKLENDQDSDWEVFKSYFADVHQNFDQKLKVIHPEITDADIRLAALLKMKLSTKEIAAILHVLPDSILKSKYRLKKKLKLDKEMDLGRFLEEV